MGLYVPPAVQAVLVWLAGSALAFLAVTLCAKITGDTEQTTRTFLRAVVAIAVFAAIYYGASFVLEYASYDVYVESIKYLAAVTGAGCYWIGSRK